MEDLVPLVAVITPFLFAFSMVWLIMHYKRQRRLEEGRPAAAVSAELADVAERMERRIEALEQILDAEAPGWRKRHHE